MWSCREATWLDGECVRMRREICQHLQSTYYGQSAVDFFFLRNSRSFIYLFIYLWLCGVFVSLRGLSLIVASGDHSSSRCAGLPPSRPLLLRSTGSRRAGSVVVAHGPSCSAAWGIPRDQGSNPCPLHWQADSQPLRHQGSPRFLKVEKWIQFGLSPQSLLFVYGLTHRCVLFCRLWYIL